MTIPRPASTEVEKGTFVIYFPMSLQCIWRSFSVDFQSFFFTWRHITTRGRKKVNKIQSSCGQIIVYISRPLWIHYQRFWSRVEASRLLFSTWLTLPETFVPVVDRPKLPERGYLLPKSRNEGDSARSTIKDIGSVWGTQASVAAIHIRCPFKIPSVAQRSHHHPQIVKLKQFRAFYQWIGCSDK